MSRLLVVLATIDQDYACETTQIADSALDRQLLTIMREAERPMTASGRLLPSVHDEAVNARHAILAKHTRDTAAACRGNQSGARL